MENSFAFNRNEFFTSIKGKLNLSSSEWETLEILFDVDQCHMLLTSLEEYRRGEVVSFSEAFGDLD